jgi:hypothetical protein
MMNTCENFQNQMLEHLYGLLEGDEGRTLTDHVRDCNPCRLAWTRAQQQKVLLTAAARSEFAGLRFEAPGAGSVPREAERQAIVPGPGSRGWLRWAVAAAVLLAVAGISIPGGWYWQQHDRVALAQTQTEYLQKVIERREMEYQGQIAADRKTRQVRIEEANKELATAQEQIRKLAEEQQSRLAQVSQTLINRQLHMSIVGPETYEPGAPNDYRIAVRNLASQPVPARISALVLNDSKEVVYEKKDVPIQGDFQLTLPRDLPLKPGTELTLEVQAKGANDQQGQLRETLKLVAPLYLTHLTTDKPMYQPGEVVHFRSLTLERFSLKPAPQDLHVVYTITKPGGAKENLVDGLALLVNDKGQAPILGPDKKPVRGIGAGEYAIDPGAPGGEYTLTVREAANRFPPQERKFIVNQYEKPRLNKELEFTRKSYGPGEEVVAACKVARVEGRVPVAHRPVTATVKVDGKTYGADGKEGGALQLQTDALGSVAVKFKLPTQIDKGEASLAVTFNEGVVETIVRTIPIVLKKLQVEFFPEGGDLVAGVPNRVYFQARTTLDKPAELRGRIVDEDGQVMTDAQTFNVPDQPGANQGMGVFSFTPMAGKKYELKVDAPANIEGQYRLPEVKPDGVVLSVPSGVTTDKEAIHVAVRSSKADRALLVGVYCRGRLMTNQRLEAKKGQAAEIDLQPETGVGGVYRVTVFEELPGDGNHVQLVPRAERLIYRVPAERLQLTIQPDKKQYVPGDRVNIQFSAADEKGQAAPAVLLVAVTDKSVLKLADEKTFRSMPTHFLLTTEVRRPEDLEHADFLLGSHPKAAQALDLLLGTQGWRRFAEQNPEQFRNQVPREAADRLLVADGRLSSANLGPKSTNFDAQALNKVLDEYRPKFEPLVGLLPKLEAKLADANVVAERPYPEEINELRRQAVASRQEYEAAATTLSEYRAIANRVAGAALPILGLGLLATGVIGVVVGLFRKSTGQALPYFLTAACSILLFAWVVAYQVNSETPFEIAQGGAPKSESTPARTAVTAPKDALMKADKAGEAMPIPPPLAAPMDEAQAFGGAGNAPAQVAGEIRQKAALPPQGPGGRPGGQPPAAMAGKPGVRGLDPANRDKDGAFRKDIKDLKAKELLLEDLGRGEAKGEARDVQLARRAAMPNAAKKQADRNGLGGERRPMGRQLNELEKEMPQLKMVHEQEQLRARMLQLRLEPEAKPQGGGGGFAPRAGFAFGDFEAGKRLEQGAEMALGIPNVPPPPLVVREYAHQHHHGEENVRSDFTETLYWQPVLVLPDGKGQASFELCDSVTTFQVLVAGNTLDGRLGAATSELEARLPLTLEPKLPIEVTASDQIDVPLTIANNTDTQRNAGIQVRATGLSLLNGKASEELLLKPDQRIRRLYRFQPNLVEGKAELRFDGQSAPLAGDSILKLLMVVPEGFPVVGSQSDVLEKVAHHDLVLPESWIKGSLKYQVAVYPSTLADLQKGLEALLREPNGCFEQTSTSNYPNVLILEYLKETDQANPDVARRAQDMLARGYEKLTSFECLEPSRNQRQGYEWFGGTAPAHEALTAYGLLQFRDMARVFDVDKTMIERTKTYLMSRKDGKGGFSRNPRALDTFGRAPDNITNAYIVWALTESGQEDDVNRELEALADQAKTSKDPYFLALVANSLINRGRNAEGITLLQRLAETQQADGHLDAAQTSITGSGGRDLQIETTALGLLAWLKGQRPDQFNPNIQRAVKWLGQQRGGYGGFGSTQSTILALKALIAFARANKKTPEAGDLVLYSGAEVVAQQHFEAGVQDAVVLNLPDTEKYLKAGKNPLRLEITGKNVFPYTATWSYQTLKPVSAAECPIRLTTALDRRDAEEGSTVRLSVKVANQSGKGQGMTVAIIGLPAGLTLPEDLKQLKDLARLRNNGTEPGPISAWEIRGRELVLYWRDLAPDKTVEVNIDLICRVPGVYRGPASRAYLYYNADHKCWVEPLGMTITAKDASER